MPFYRLSGIFDSISQVAKFTRRWDDDFIESINHRWSCLILVVMTVTVSLKQYAGEPIVCWCDGTWSGAMVEYAHQICWISNTYYLPPGTAPLTRDEPRVQILVYYQWVPFILLAQAFLFQLPNLLWKSCSKFIGIDLNRMSRTVSGMENVNPETRDRTVRVVVKQIDRSLAISAWRSGGKVASFFKKAHNYLCILGCGRGFGNYLITLYIFIKILYIGNTVGQLFALNYVLGAESFGMHFLFMGVKLINDLSSGIDVHSGSRIFPRVTMCDFDIRQMSNEHKYTIECALPINLFNEKIFIFLWFWLVAMTLLNFLSLIAWISALFAMNRTSYVKKYLCISERMRRTRLDKKHLKCFTELYLRQDGVFAIRILSKNTNDVVVAEIVCKLWDHFILHHGKNKEFHRDHTPEDTLDFEEDTGNGYRGRSYNRPNQLDVGEGDRNKAKSNATTPGNIFPISGFLDGISRMGKFAARWDDDFFDRVNHRYSTVVLLVFTVVVSTKQYVGEPIVCWTPATFTGAMVEYAHQVCWISNTYYLPRNQAPLTRDQPRDSVLIYYQWVPFILLTQAFLFQVTNIFWSVLSSKNGVDVNRLVMMVSSSDNIHPEVREKTILQAVNNLDQAIVYAYWRRRSPVNKFVNRFKTLCCCFFCGKGYGNYLTGCYLLCKILYIGNALGQLFLLNYLLGSEALGLHFAQFGIYVVKLLIQGKDVGANSIIFPRVTMCDFQIRQFSNNQDYTVECALPINLFSEKFFIFLWFWIVLVFFANIYSLLSWLWCIFSVSRVSYVKKYVKLAERVNKNDLDRRHISCFADEYLRHDGIFCLRMLSSNTNDVIAAQVIAHLWNNYKLHHSDSPEFHKPHKFTGDYDFEDGNSLLSEPINTRPRSRRRTPRRTPPPPSAPSTPADKLSGF